MKYNNRRRTLLALLLCGALLLTGGPMQSMAVSASNDDGGIEEVDNGGTSDDGVEDEPSDPGNDGADSGDDSDSGDGDDGGEESTSEESSAEESDVEEEVTTTSTSGYNSEKVNNLQNKISDLNERIAGLAEDNKRLEANIAAARTERERAMAEQQSLDKKITNTTDEITYLEERILLLEEDIVLKQEGIAQKQKEIDYNYDLLKKRIRSQYMNDDGSMLGLLLTADSFSDFLTHTEYMVRIAQHDRNLMSNLTVERNAIEEEKVALEESKVQVETDKSETESKRQDLGRQRSAAALMVQDLNDMEAHFNAEREKNEAIRKQMDAEIQDAYRQIELSKNPYVGGEMAWPLPGFFNVSSEYGSRFGGSDFHTGMDITGTGCYGATIQAANDGVVKFTNTAYTDGYGYGIYCIIDHGGNVSTLYAHCSGLLVSVGQEVKAGDPIALVGSTGWSTGPHLHFEVRQGTSAVNPRPYVTGK